MCQGSFMDFINLKNADFRDPDPLLLGCGIHRAGPGAGRDPLSPCGWHGTGCDRVRSVNQPKLLLCPQPPLLGPFPLFPLNPFPLWSGASDPLSTNMLSRKDFKMLWFLHQPGTVGPEVSAPHHSALEKPCPSP